VLFLLYEQYNGQTQSDEETERAVKV